MRSEAMSPVTTPRGLRPWWHGRQGLDRGNLWHGWNQRYGLTWGKRGDGWHRWNRGDGRFHDASAWPAPHLIGAAYSHRDDEKWHEPEHDDHQHGSVSHRVCPPGRNAVTRRASAHLRVSSIRTAPGHVNTTGVAGLKFQHRDHA